MTFLATYLKNVSYVLKNKTNILLLIILIFLTIQALNMSSEQSLVSVEFEVYGIVQGVFFRKYTKKEANHLGLKGWCMNTSQGTVKGCMEGTTSSINEMKNWLQNVGSPQSKIDKAVFSNQKIITNYSFKSFDVKH